MYSVIVEMYVRTGLGYAKEFRAVSVNILQELCLDIQF